MYIYKALCCRSKWTWPGTHIHCVVFAIHVFSYSHLLTTPSLSVSAIIAVSSNFDNPNGLTGLTVEQQLLTVLSCYCMDARAFVCGVCVCKYMWMRLLNFSKTEENTKNFFTTDYNLFDDLCENKDLQSAQITSRSKAFRIEYTYFIHNYTYTKSPHRHAKRLCLHVVFVEDVHWIDRVCVCVCLYKAIVPDIIQCGLMLS